MTQRLNDDKTRVANPTKLREETMALLFKKTAISDQWIDRNKRTLLDKMQQKIDWLSSVLLGCEILTNEGTMNMLRQTNIRIYDALSGIDGDYAAKYKVFMNGRVNEVTTTGRKQVDACIRNIDQSWESLERLAEINNAVNDMQRVRAAYDALLQKCNLRTSKVDVCPSIPLSWPDT
jgi:hypothetical protein